MRIDNKTAAEALAAIQNAEGRLTPDAVVRAAKNARHPLHDAFEWDDTKAGHAYRIAQARELIARVRIEVTESEVRRIAYVRDPEVEPDEQGYRSTLMLADDKQQARAAVLNEMYRVLACLQRVGDVARSLGIETDIAALIANAESLVTAIERPARRKTA